MGPTRFLFPEWYDLPLLLLQTFAKKYTINCKIIGKVVERNIFIKNGRTFTASQGSIIE